MKAVISSVALSGSVEVWIDGATSGCLCHPFVGSSFDV